MGNVFTPQPERDQVTFDCQIAEKFARNELRVKGGN